MRLSTYRRLLSIWVTSWAPLALGGTLLFGASYGAMQQAIRQGGNDPQIQLAQDGALALARGAATSSVLSMAAGQPVEPGLPHVDMLKSRGTFIQIFDDAGALVGTTGYIASSTPTPPSGTLDYARDNRENRFTWQPNPDVRIAAVVVRYKSGFVLVGRSLREIESRERQLGLIMGSAWAIFIIVTLVAIANQYVRERIRRAEDFISQR